MCCVIDILCTRTSFMILTVGSHSLFYARYLKIYASRIDFYMFHLFVLPSIFISCGVSEFWVICPVTTMQWPAPACNKCRESAHLEYFLDSRQRWVDHDRVTLHWTDTGEGRTKIPSMPPRGLMLVGIFFIFLFDFISGKSRYRFGTPRKQFTPCIVEI